jgi:hypothetical protein
VQKEFDPTKPVYARRQFVANGRTYKPGDAFDWKRNAIVVRKVRQLYDAGKVFHGDEIGFDRVQRPADTSTHNVLQSPYPKVYKSRPEAVVNFADSPSETIERMHSSVADGDPDPFTVCDEDLDDIDSLKELKEIAEREGAKIGRSKEKQREYIRENRENKG